ncbi:hypothetical protein C1I92_29745, partial [Jiangella anatolica]
MAGCVVVLAAGAGVVLERRGELPWLGDDATADVALFRPSAPPSPAWAAAGGVLDAPAAAGVASEPAVADVLAPALGASGLGGRCL